MESDAARQMLARYAAGERNFSWIQLAGADLRGADLRDANFYGADLSRANLSGADLTRVTLDDADLYYASLSGASLSGANLSGANLSGADMSDVIKPTTMPVIPAIQPGAAVGEAPLASAGVIGASAARSCIHCGASLPTAAIFCSRCGQSQLAAAVPSIGAPPAQAMPAPFAPLAADGAAPAQAAPGALPPQATAGVQWCMRCGVGMPPGAAQCPRCGWAPTPATQYAPPSQSNNSSGSGSAVARGIGQYVSQRATGPQGAPRTTTPPTQKNAYAPPVSPTVRSSKSPMRSYLQTLGLGVLLVIGGIALPAQTEQCTTDSFGQYCIETVYTYNGVSAPVVKGLLIVAGILCVVVVGYLLISRNTQQK